MGDAPPASSAISAAFPAPPPFYKSFTSANLSQLSALQESDPNLSPESLPPNLRLLLPPAPPADGSYTTFGETNNVSPPNPPRPPPPNPHRLLATTRSLLLTFLSLVNSLAVDPDSWAPKWDELRALFLEAHGIVNEYRPHQARETLVAMMEAQVERCRAEREGCVAVCEKVKNVLDGIKEGKGIEKIGGAGGKMEGKKVREIGDGEKEIWGILEEEVGTF